MCFEQGSLQVTWAVFLKFHEASNIFNNVLSGILVSILVGPCRVVISLDELVRMVEEMQEQCNKLLEEHELREEMSLPSCWGRGEGWRQGGMEARGWFATSCTQDHASLIV